MSDAQILDRGYRRFEGERAGLRGSVGSLTWHTSRSILGLGRKARYKIVPVFIIVVAFLPVIAFLALAILVGDQIFYMNVQGENSGIQFRNKFTLPQFR